MSSTESYELIYSPEFNMTQEKEYIGRLTDTDPVIDHKLNKLTGITNLPEPVRIMLKSRGVLINLLENNN